MIFDKFLKKCENETHLLKYNFGGDPERRKHLENLWMIHQTIETNKRLVWATWALAFVTIILSLLTLYFQYLS